MDQKLRSMLEASIYQRVEELLHEARQLSARHREILREVESLLEGAERTRPEPFAVH